MEFIAETGRCYTFDVDPTDNESLAASVEKEYEFFDVDEDVLTFINLRGKNGVPETLSELLQAAQSIENILKEISENLEDILEEIEEERDEDLDI